MVRYVEQIPVAIDLMSVVLPTSVYLDLIEKFHPRQPLIETLEEVFKKASITDLKEINAKIEAVYESAKVLQEVSSKFM